MGNRLYVGNLPFQTTEDELRDFFSQTGGVDEVKVVTDRETGRSRGFGFVTMSTDEEAQKAIAELDGTEMGGRALRVNEAEQRRDRGGGGRGGGGGGRGGDRGGRGGRGGDRGGRGGGRWG